MRGVVLGITSVVVVYFAFVVGSRGEVQAQQPGAQQPVAPAVKPLVLSDGLIALSSDTVDAQQQVTVIDSKTRVMSVYHIDHKTGAIALKSVRNLSADLMIEEFNTDSPLPREVRAMLIKNKR